jgi:hypothetical protein
MSLCQSVVDAHAANMKNRSVQTNDVKPINDWRESITPTSLALRLRWSHCLFKVARRFLVRRRRPVYARRFASGAIITQGLMAITEEFWKVV